MREPPTYRIELEQILEFFGNKRILSVRDVVAYTGRGKDWVAAHLGVTGHGITAAQLAMKMANYK